MSGIIENWDILARESERESKKEKDMVITRNTFEMIVRCINCIYLVV